MNLTDPEFLSKTAYLRLLDSSRDAVRLALAEAQENRRFEIELYWRRSSYFWLFVAIAFSGFFALSASPASAGADIKEARVLISWLGLLFSLGWYLANRGSKFWQEVWERHIDLLEDRVYGPLHKTLVAEEACCYRGLLNARRFSVSRINLVLNLTAAAAWAFLVIRSTSDLLGLPEPIAHFNLYVIWALGVVLGAILFLCSHSRNGSAAFSMKATSVRDDPSNSTDL